VKTWGMMTSQDVQLLVVFSCCVLPLSVVYIFRKGGSRVLGFLLLFGYSTTMLWAFLFGCAYEPIRWIKVVEIIMCSSTALFAAFYFIKEVRG
jgi:hypothetical protein